MLSPLSGETIEGYAEVFESFRPGNDISCNHELLPITHDLRTMPTDII